MKLRKSSKKGFTLIELIVVIAILGILAAILVPTITGFIQTAKDNTDVANAKMLYTSGVLAVSTDELFSKYVSLLPEPQGKEGAFEVYNNAGQVKVYINGTTTDYSYDPTTTLFTAVTIPTASDTIVLLSE